MLIATNIGRFRSKQKSYKDLLFSIYIHQDLLCSASDLILPIQNLCGTSLLLFIFLKKVNIGTAWFAYLMY